MTAALDKCQDTARDLSGAASTDGTSINEHVSQKFMLRGIVRNPLNGR